MMLRGDRVLARCEEDGTLRAEGGRVEIRYKPTDARAYRAGARNLSPVDGAEILPDDHCVDGAAPPDKKKEARGGSSAPTSVTADEVLVYADGACSGNPGPAGIGVVRVTRDDRRELSEYLGEATNNIAELTAILRAAEAMDDPARPLRLYTDSSYSIGVLTKGWKAKANKELVARVKGALAKLEDVELHPVRGHAGHALNERADQLAVEAVETRSTAGWREV
jgi:ribonuclease HI